MECKKNIDVNNNKLSKSLKKRDGNLHIKSDLFRKNMNEAVDFCIDYMENPEVYSVTTGNFFNFT